MKTVLILSNHFITLYNFRRELIQTLLDNHYRVVISFPEDENGFFEKMGCTIVSTPVDRRGTNPIADLKLCFAYRKIMKDVNPDVVLSYTIKPNVYGGMACRLWRRPMIANVTGLGTSIENGGLMAWITKLLYKMGLKKATMVFFQNESNMQLLQQKKIVQGRCVCIPGSGVNLLKHPMEEYPAEKAPIRLLFIGRIMRNKGVSELIECAKRAQEDKLNVKFTLIGLCDEPSYLDELKFMTQSGTLQYLSYQSDVHSFIKSHHAVVLPSYHEGLANVLLEAAASGRPVLASDISGCRETFSEETGIGFQSRNADDLYRAIQDFVALPHNERAKMGRLGRKKVEQEFDRKLVIQAYMDEIEKITER